MEIIILIPLLIALAIMQFCMCILGFFLTAAVMKLARKNVDDVLIDTRLDHHDVTEQTTITLYVREVFLQETRVTSLFFWKIWALHSVPYIWIGDMKRYGRHLSIWTRSSNSRAIYPYVMKALISHGHSN